MWQFPHYIATWRPSAVSSPLGVGVGAPTAWRVSIIFSTQGGLSWLQNVFTGRPRSSLCMQSRVLATTELSVRLSVARWHCEKDASYDHKNFTDG